MDAADLPESLRAQLQALESARSRKRDGAGDDDGDGAGEEDDDEEDDDDPALVRDCARPWLWSQVDLLCLGCSKALPLYSVTNCHVVFMLLLSCCMPSDHAYSLDRTAGSMLSTWCR